MIIASVGFIAVIIGGLLVPISSGRMASQLECLHC